MKKERLFLSDKNFLKTVELTGEEREVIWWALCDLIEHRKERGDGSPFFEYEDTVIDSAFNKIFSQGLCPISAKTIGKTLPRKVVNGIIIEEKSSYIDKDMEKGN